MLASFTSRQLDSRSIKIGFGGQMRRIPHPMAPHKVQILIEWPLPGAADWVEVPSENAPWEVCPGQLFDTNSSRALNCDHWLGQQVEMFDRKGISLGEIIRTVVNYEGAHAINVGRLLEIEGQEHLKAARNPEIHILNNVTLFGIRYAHMIVIKSALYLYGKLLEEPAIERPSGDHYMIKPRLICTQEQATSPRPDWVRFEGMTIVSFGREKMLTRHTIKAVN